MIFKEKNLGDITDQIYDYQQCKINGTDKLEDRYKIKYRNKEYTIRILKYDIFILILDEIKDYFKIPHSEKCKALIFKNGVLTPVLVSIYQKEINISQFNENFTDEFYGKLSVEKLKECSSFMFEIRRLFAFRFIMCLSNNTESKIDIIIKKISPKITLDNIVNKEIYIPTCLRESSYLNSTSFSDKILKAELTDVSKIVIEKWFDNSYEIFYETVQSLLIGIDFTRFKMMIIDIIQKYIKETREEFHKHNCKENLQKVRDVESLIWWSNAVSERIRQF